MSTRSLRPPPLPSSPASTAASCPRTRRPFRPRTRACCGATAPSRSSGSTTGGPFALADHLDRLERSAANLRLDGVPRRELESEIPELLGGARRGRVRRLPARRADPRRPPSAAHRAAPGDARSGSGSGVVEYAPTRVLDGIKSLSYGANMLCGRLARERGFDEALLVTPHGRVLEAPTSSIFWVDADGAHLHAAAQRAHPRVDHASTG